MPGEKGHLEAKWAYTRSTDGSKVWRFGGLTEYNVSGGGTSGSYCYCAGAAQLCRLQTLSFVLRIIVSKPTLSSAFLLEFV